MRKGDPSAPLLTKPWTDALAARRWPEVSWWARYWANSSPMLSPRRTHLVLRITTVAYLEREELSSCLIRPVGSTWLRQALVQLPRARLNDHCLSTYLTTAQIEAQVETCLESNLPTRLHLHARPVMPSREFKSSQRLCNVIAEFVTDV